MPQQIQAKKCTFCNSELAGEYCSSCGNPKDLKRINGTYILSEIGSVVNFDKGILYTIRELLLRPGLSVRNFMSEDRNRLVKPIVFIIITSLTYTLIQQTLGFEDGYIGFGFEDNSATFLIFEWISENYGYANVLMAVFIGLWLKLFFRKHDYNFFEILILLCFMMGMSMLLFSFFGIIESFTNANILDKGFLIAILYISWGIGQFFEKKKLASFLKAFFSYMLGMMTFSLFAVGLGFLIDLINK